ncbi:MAG TPA: RelA/SpoT domain-containing protein [Chthoniobacterales bacterium]|nr:RelA/SpoT domain-containing protein [Chthoniobacterales bacterium]
MEWIEPEYERRDVNAAAKELLKNEALRGAEYQEASLIVNNWRYAHNYPLNTFKVTLRAYAKKAFPPAIVAERRKRLESILSKLQREPSMKLTQMQDIAGCRAIVGSVASVDRLVDIYQRSDLKHKLHHVKDYIASPKPSGYRGAHMIYEYFSDKRDTWNGLKVELQFRSPLQHVWATAVETVGAFTKQALKSSRGQAEWLRFFALMGSHIARIEKTALVPNTPQDETELRSELSECATQLNAFSQLEGFQSSIGAIDEPGLKESGYYLLELNTASTPPSLNVTGYKKSDLKAAMFDSTKAEKNPDLNVVLVAVSSLKTLKRAYPNYYADTESFLRILRKAVS